MDENNEKCTNMSISLPFADERTAEIVFNVLRVDPEPKASSVKKTLTLKENLVNVEFSGPLTKQLKIASHNYFKNILLILETIEYTGAARSKEYSHF